MKFILFMIVVMIFGTSATHAGEVNVKKLLNQNWIRMESDQFSIISDAKEAQVTAMLQELQNFSYFMTEILGFEQKRLTKKIEVVAARNSSTLSAMGIPKDFAGVFLNSHGSLMFARADNFRASTKGSNYGRQVLLHELVHVLIADTNAKIAIPPWYNEGVAEYLGSYTQKKNQIILGDLKVLEWRFGSMATNFGRRLESVDTETLFSTSYRKLGVADNMNDEQDEFISKFYARSLATVHYFNADPERRKNMYKFLYLQKMGYGIDESFSGLFKMSYKELDQQIDEYISSKYVLARTFPVGEQGVNFPEVQSLMQAVDQREAMVYLFNSISYMSDSFLGFGNRDKMNADFEKYIPGFFSARD